MDIANMSAVNESKMIFLLNFIIFEQVKKTTVFFISNYDLKACIYVYGQMFKKQCPSIYVQWNCFFQIIIFGAVRIYMIQKNNLYYIRTIRVNKKQTINQKIVELAR